MIVTASERTLLECAFNRTKEKRKQILGKNHCTLHRPVDIFVGPAIVWGTGRLPGSNIQDMKHWIDFIGTMTMMYKKKCTERCQEGCVGLLSPHFIPSVHRNPWWDRSQKGRIRKREKPIKVAWYWQAVSIARRRGALDRGVPVLPWKIQPTLCKSDRTLFKKKVQEPAELGSEGCHLDRWTRAGAWRGRSRALATLAHFTLCLADCMSELGHVTAYSWL